MSVAKPRKKKEAVNKRKVHRRNINRARKRPFEL